MFGGIRRVISESEDMMGPTTTTAAAAAMNNSPERRAVAAAENVDAQQQSPGEGGAAAAANLIEPEMQEATPMDVDDNDNDNSNAPLILVHSSNQSGSTSSSLSDDDDAEECDTPLLSGDLLLSNNNNNDNNLQQNDDKQKMVKSTLKKSPTTTLSAQEVQTEGASSAINMEDSTNNSSTSEGGDGDNDDGLSQVAKSSQTSRDWGWFEDVHQSISEGLDKKGGGGGGGGGGISSSNNKNKKGAATPQQTNDASAMAVTAPTYVLEESLSSQKLWKDTAGNRPPQPLEERAFFEKMWAQNFALSQVNYSMPVEVLTASSPISLNPFADGLGFEGSVGTATAAAASYNIPVGTAAIHPSHLNKPGDVAEAALVSRMTEDVAAGGSTLVHQRVRGHDGDLTVLLRGPNAFGTTVSKSFARSSSDGGPISGVDTINISIASYRVVESKKCGKFAQFLVIYRDGSIRDTIGIWKRYRDFEDLAHKVTQSHEGCASAIANMTPLSSTPAVSSCGSGAGSGSSSRSRRGSSGDGEMEQLPNAVTSWYLLKKRKRWYRCLDAGYLSLKVFLLERFLHDILFESSSPQLLRDFVLGPQQPPENLSDA